MRFHIQTTELLWALKVEATINLECYLKLKSFKVDFIFLCHQCKVNNSINIHGLYLLCETSSFTLYSFALTYFIYSLSLSLAYLPHTQTFSYLHTTIYIFIYIIYKYVCLNVCVCVRVKVCVRQCVYVYICIVSRTEEIHHPGHHVGHGSASSLYRTYHTPRTHTIICLRTPCLLVHEANTSMNTSA